MSRLLETWDSSNFNWSHHELCSIEQSAFGRPSKPDHSLLKTQLRARPYQCASLQRFSPKRNPIPRSIHENDSCSIRTTHPGDGSGKHARHWLRIIPTTTLTSSTTNGRRAQRFSRKTGTEAIRSIISRTTFAVRQRDMSGARSMGITCWRNRTERSFLFARLPTITRLPQPSVEQEIPGRSAKAGLGFSCRFARGSERVEKAIFRYEFGASYPPSTSQRASLS